MMTPEELLLQRKFNKHAAFAVLERTVAEELLERLQWVTLQPTVMMECGLGTAELQKRYPNATILSMDAMQDTHSVDLIVANLLLPWCENVEAVFQEWHRILRPNGVLMFSTFGPDTLKELQHLPFDFPYLFDIQDMGDALVRAKFRDPVMDREDIQLQYQDKHKMITELTEMHLMKGADPEAVITNSDSYSLTLEILYGQAWGGVPQKKINTGEIRIPIKSIRTMTK